MYTNVFYCATFAQHLILEVVNLIKVRNIAQFSVDVDGYRRLIVDETSLG